MTNSDIIAIIAIVLSAVISVTSSVISFLVNRTNIQAKRSEIALERRLEAFREVVEKTGKIKMLLSFNSDKSDYENAKDDIETTLIDFFESYRKNLVFLPPSISKSVTKYGSIFFEFVHKKYTAEHAKTCLKELNEIEKQMIDDMQKFVGYT